MNIKKCIMILSISWLFILMSCSETDTPVDSNDQANAYYTVFTQLYEIDPGLNHDSEYLAVDLSNVLLSDTTGLIKLIQDFCDNNGYTLLQDSIDGLREKGYIEDLYFEDGFVIIFNDSELKEGKLVTAAQKWRSGLGAIGAEYTVSKTDDSWEITKETNSWIS